MLLCLGFFASANVMSAPSCFVNPTTNAQQALSDGANCVNGSGTSISTSSVNSPGMQDGSPGKTGVTLTNSAGGDITTSGNGSAGFLSRGSSVTINNAGSVVTNGSDFSGGQYSDAIGSYGASAVINNTGSITTNGYDAFGVYSTGAGVRISNSGSITINGGYANGIAANDSLLIENTGSIKTIGSNSPAIQNRGAGSKTSNTGQINTTGDDSSGILDITNHGELSNAGKISTSGNRSAGVLVLSTDLTFLNSGSIETTGIESHGVHVFDYSAGTVLTNLGTISATGANSYGIYVADYGNVASLTNAQGGNNPLTYYGNLPTFYNVVISGASYGKLAVTNAGSSQTTFGITSDSVVASRRYAALLTGVSASNIAGATSGTVGGFTYNLVQVEGTDQWDLLIPTYVNAANTLAAVQQNASGLATVINLQTAALQAGLSYDCTVYDENNLCVSAGGRYTYAGASPSGNAQAGLVIVGYRPVQNFRLGAYADQTVANATPSGITQKNNGPMFGFFGNWNLNKDGNGLGVQAAVALSQSKLDITRSSQLAYTEAGSGSTQLGGQGWQLKANYAQPVTDSTKLIPYLGLMYTRLNIGGYTESASSSVNYPLTYNALAQSNFAAIGGVGMSSLLMEKLTGTLSVGIQQNLNYSMGNYQGTSQLPGLYSFSVQMPGYNSTGATATAGLYYDVNKRERLGFNVLWQQQPFIATNTTTALATYTIGF